MAAAKDTLGQCASLLKPSKLQGINGLVKGQALPPLAMNEPIDVD